MRGRGKTDDDGEGSLHNPLRVSRSHPGGRLRHLLGWIERSKLDQLRRVGDGFACGCCANSSIDGILSAVGAGEGGQCEDVSLVESRHGRTVVTVSAFWVSVPVLSEHKTTIDAASSTAERRVGRTPSFARERALIADASVKVAGSATGIDARMAVSTSGMISVTGILRYQA